MDMDLLRHFIVKNETRQLDWIAADIKCYTTAQFFTTDSLSLFPVE